MNAPRAIRALVSACALIAPAVEAATVSSASSSWTALAGNYDYLADQQTGQPASDIVGSGTNGGFFTTFNNNGSASSTDGTLGFRIRLDEADGNKNNPAWSAILWVGIEANGDNAIDVFLGVGMQGSTPVMGIYAPGGQANTSPSTTSIASSATYSYTRDANNYSYRPVNYLTDGGTTNDATPSTTGDPDYYLSFMMPFADIVGFLKNNKSINITDQSSLRYVVATSTQTNSLNQDLGGVNGGVNSAQTWSQLGGFSQTVNASGNTIPEPSSFVMIAPLTLLAALRRRRN
ncbi:hypothetical protein [Haloferula sp. BvORR071]|uniref:hypothetical protein n=1 Tax=Haloferula sp. BvORR071 TaxID=1396141 RepID=UPI00055037AD|nr:hypothetical protein [Haloferula sp. BvORR071]